MTAPGRAGLRSRFPAAVWLSLAAGPLVLAGCHGLMVNTDSRVAASGHVTAGVNGTFDVRLPAANDPGPVVPVVIRTGAGGPQSPRVAILDVDGLILNQNFTGPGSVGENPVATFREKLEAAACDPRVRAVVIRVNSPGGGVAASDLMAEELKRFRRVTGKPTVASMLDVATGGALYLAVGCDRVVALPTTITGGVGALFNHPNLKRFEATYNIFHDSVKSGDKLDMGTVSENLTPETRALFQEMTDEFRDQFVNRVAACRPSMKAQDRAVLNDGRVFPAQKALALRLIDSLGYPDDAVAEAERVAGVPGAEVVLFEREGYPARSIYSSAPNTPLQATLAPFSLPGIERAKLPTFLYLWQPEPTLTRLSGQ